MNLKHISAPISLTSYSPGKKNSDGARKHSTLSVKWVLWGTNSYQHNTPSRTRFMALPLPVTPLNLEGFLQVAHKKRYSGSSFHYLYLLTKKGVAGCSKLLILSLLLILQVIHREKPLNGNSCKETYKGIESIIGQKKKIKQKQRILFSIYHYLLLPYHIFSRKSHSSILSGVSSQSQQQHHLSIPALSTS